MKIKNKPQKYYSRVSYNFKIALVVLLFSIILVRLILLFNFPGIDIISDKALLFVLLFIVLYLWIQELRDYHDLLLLNKDLQDSGDKLKQAEIDTIASLIKAEEEKDEYTRGHSERVTKIALALAEELGLDDSAKNIIARAGILHDIGKIGISDAILNKIQKLTDEEWSVIKSHPRKAIEILEPLKFLNTEKNIILRHHERYDGTGYPEGRKVDDIGREAMIIAIADAFDAMNSRRAYREPLSKEKIISELKKSRGTQHSAEMVDVFLALLEKKLDLWER